MSVIQYFDVIGILLKVLVLITFTLLFLYIVYCEREKTSSEQRAKGH